MSYFGDDKSAQLNQKNNEIIELVMLLSQRDEKLTRKDAEISRYEKEFSRKDAEISRYEKEFSRKDAEISRYEKEFSRKDAKLSQRDEELALLTCEIEKLKQDSNDIIEAQFNLRKEHERNELHKYEIIQLKQNICDLTVVEPIDIQEKLGEMFDIWTSVIKIIQPSIVSEMSTHIRASIEQIKEPIVDLFHIAYMIDRTGYYHEKLNITAFIITTSNIYKLKHWSCRSDWQYPDIEIMQGYDSYLYRYEWIKVGTIDKSINLKTLRKYIKTTSGFTGTIITPGSNIGSSQVIGSKNADIIAERLIKDMIDIVIEKEEKE